jgi:hypothetical protein
MDHDRDRDIVEIARTAMWVIDVIRYGAVAIVVVLGLIGLQLILTWWG